MKNILKFLIILLLCFPLMTYAEENEKETFNGVEIKNNVCNKKMSKVSVEMFVTI